MAIIPAESPFDPVLEIENGTLDGKPCVHAYYVAISEASFEANDSGPGAMRDKVLLATVTEDALRMFPINVRRGMADRAWFEVGISLPCQCH
jgi:hypothetical protein